MKIEPEWCWYALFLLSNHPLLNPTPPHPNPASPHLRLLRRIALQALPMPHGRRPRRRCLQLDPCQEDLGQQLAGVGPLRLPRQLG